MIKQTLSLLGRLNAAPNAVTMLDGDTLEISIIRDGQRMAILNLSHYEIGREGQHVPVDPLPIQIRIEAAQGDGQRPFSDESN